MPTEVALLESHTLRVEQMGRVDALDKVKSLVMLPVGIHVRTEVVGAISTRLSEVSQDIVRLDARMDDIARRLKELSRRRRG